MKKVGLFMAVFAAMAVFVWGINSATAAKPLDVIQLSNGFPSGEHFNLVIHGKKSEHANVRPAAAGLPPRQEGCFPAACTIGQRI